VACDLKAEIISVGTEILLGNIVNTNAAFLAEECASLGISVFYQTTVGDNRERLLESMKLAAGRADLLIITGGLGPTEDDLTKETAAEYFGVPLVEDPHTKERIKLFFQRLGRSKIAENNWKQALVPQGASVLDNPNGSAPGLILEKDGCVMILLPGPPEELVSLWKSAVLSYLQKKQNGVIRSRIVKVCGIGESDAEMLIKDLIRDQTNPTIATYAKTGEVHLRITASADSEEEAFSLTDKMVARLGERFGSNIYTSSRDVTLEMAFVDLLRKKGYSLTTAESCSGGMLAGRIINVPGASDVYDRGFITYSNKAKEDLLDVSGETLSKYGAVSYETAYEMACGAARNAEADVAIAVTGVAGPGGGTAEKPVGLVYIGVFVVGHVKAFECHFPGDRTKIRAYTVARALTLARAEIMALSD